LNMRVVVTALAVLLLAVSGEAWAFGPSPTLRSTRQLRHASRLAAVVEGHQLSTTTTTSVQSTSSSSQNLRVAKSRVVHPTTKSPQQRRLSQRALCLLPMVLVVAAPAVASEVPKLPQLLEGVPGGVLFQATSLVFLSEIGDKTFFIASILAARASRVLAFAGAFGALALMTVASVVIGQIFHSVPDSLTRGIPVDDYVAVLSFAYFGVKSIAAAFSDEVDGLQTELEDAERELASKSLDKGRGLGVVAEAFALTVAAEIGDRSQITTIALSAAQNPYVVTVGACLGHGLATGIAVIGGAFISKFVNEKQISLIAGVLFIVFAATTLFALF